MADSTARAGSFTAARGVVVCSRYQLVRFLGQGGVCQVWLARDKVMDGDVAVKLLPPELWRDVEAQTNLKLEAKLTRTLAHPNIVRLMTLEPGSADTPPVLVMEYVAGESLAQLLARREKEQRPLSPEEAWPILDGLTSALDHAHLKGLVHRDIKPSNILLEARDDGRLNAKLADFGLAAEVTSFRTRQTGSVPTGTVVYMSPEQLRCRRLDGRADLYSLGVTLFQMLTFALPFSGPDVGPAILSERPKIPENLPLAVARVLEKALAKTPEERYASASDFAMAYYETIAAHAETSFRPQLAPPETADIVARAQRNPTGMAEDPTRAPIAAQAASPGPPAKLVELEPVSFTAVTHGAFTAGSTAEMDVWVHRGSEWEAVSARARTDFGPDAKVRTKAGVRLAPGAELEMVLAIPAFGATAQDTLTWNGELANASLAFAVPATVEPGSYPGTVSVLASGFAIAQIQLALSVLAAGSHVPAHSAHTTVRAIRSAFASYATPDRDAVLVCVQALQKVLPDLDVFLDVATLRSGQDWKQRLRAEVAARDVVFLFWSRAASASEWVALEWRTALDTRGLGAIDPFPLEPPDLAPAPPELASLHFGDWTLAHRRSAHALAAARGGPRARIAVLVVLILIALAYVVLRR